MAQCDLRDHPQHDIPVRGRAEGMRIRAVGDLRSIQTKTAPVAGAASA